MIKNRILISVLLIALTACTRPLLVQSDQPHQADLNQYKTFRFAEDDPVNFAFNEANRERIRAFIAEELSQRNYIQSDLADLEVRINGAIEMVRESAVDYRHGMYPYYYPPYYYSGDWQGKDFNNSSLIINIFEADNKKLLWQGVATGNFKPKKKQHIETALAAVIHNIFEQFPYHSSR